MKNQIFVFALGATLALFTACKKESSVTTFEESIATSQELTAQQDEVQSNDDEITYQVDERGGGDNDCPTRTWAQPKGTYPNTLTIDFGTTGCVGKDGKTRKGQLVVTFAGGDVRTVSGATRTVTHANHSVDEVKVEGTKTLTNNGLNANGQPSFSRVVDNHKLTFPDGKFSQWSSAQTLTMTNGYATPLIRLDDVFAVNGASNGTNRNGKTFATTTLTPLVKKATCSWFVSGSKQLTLNGDKTITINYGDGSCNRVATLTLPNGTTKEVNVKRWW